MRAEIVAECGCGHLGSMKIAKAMIDAAKWAGADTVKFQLYETLMINDPKLHLFLGEVRLDFGELAKLKEYCDEVDIGFLCSAFDIPSLEVLATLCDRIKIPSGQLHSKSYLEAAKSLGKPLILSTGMSTYKEIREASKILGRNDLIILLCNSAYPTPDDDMNLKNLVDNLQYIQPQIGLSDHSIGNVAAIMAVALEAPMIEKHFMLSPFFKTPDTETSMTPEELKQYVVDIRRAEVMLGSGEKNLTKSEQPNLHRRDYR